MNTTPKNCRDAWEHMTELTSDRQVRNFVQLLDLSDYVVETELFPIEVLETYSALNMGRDVGNEQRAHVTAHRGGAQGDYSDGMPEKIANVIDCLTRFPQSKRAVIAVCNNTLASHESDADAKCLREIQMYLDDDGRLSGTLYMRAQSATLFPKNIHMVGSIMSEVAASLPGTPALGTLFYLATTLTADR